jgi:TolA-binding protein
MRHLNLLFGCLSALVLSSCITTEREKKMKDDIFNLQTRLMELDKNSKVKTEEIHENTNQKMASTSTQIDRVKIDVQKIAGEIDALKVGITTGQMPGGDPNAPSVAASIATIMTRLDEIEAKLDAIQTKQAAAPASNKSGNSDSLASGKVLRAAFKDKKYSQIASDVPDFIASAKDKSYKLEATFYLAESLFKLNKTREAALRFNEFLDLGGTGDQVPYSKLRLGDCFKAIGDNSTAKLYYEDVTKNHSKSPEAEKAKKQLKEIGSKGASLNPKTGKSQTATIPERKSSNLR